MSYGFLLDEHLPRWWPVAIRRRQPALDVRRVGGPGAPPLQSPDPILLDWCEANGFLLLTNNRRSMPGHLAGHLAAGRHVPGIIQVEASHDVKDLADTFALIAGASLLHEYQDRILSIYSL